MKYRFIGEDNPSLGTIFQNRGLNPQSIMKASEGDLLDPFLLKNMEEAVAKVHEALVDEAVIFIQQDPDADGYTSTSLLYKYLKKVKPETNIVVLIHEDKAHGIEFDKVKEAVETGLFGRGLEKFLVIAPDASSNEHDVHKRIWELGVDVVVLDHHEAESYSPYATMVNPSLDSYPNKNISGVGVVQKFAKAYDATYGHSFADEFFDLVAIGLVGDMIELTTPETVHMVQTGMRNVKDLFLKALYDKQNYSMKGNVTPTNISFYIAPLINAVTRTGTPEEKKLITRAMTSLEAEDIPSTKRGAKEGDTEILQEQAVRIMTNIKARQDREVRKAMESVMKTIEEKNLTENQMLIIDGEHQFKKDFNGLIANKLMAEFQKPVLLGNVSEIHNEKKEFVKTVLAGSGRTSDKSDLPDLRGFLNESGIVNFAEGHGAAHGFGVDLSRVSELQEYANDKLSDFDFTPTYRLDFSMDYTTMDMAFLEQLTNMSSFWARGFEEPLFMIKNVPVAKKEFEITGDFDSSTLKISKGGFTALKFRLSEEKIAPFLKSQQVVVDIIGRVAMSEYKGTKSLTIFMEDFEVKREQQFYF